MSNTFFDLDHGLIFLSITIVSSKLDKSATSLSFNRKLNVVWSGNNGDGIRKRLELLADSAEFTGVDGDERAVFGFWDGKVFNIEGDKVEVEFS